MEENESTEPGAQAAGPTPTLGLLEWFEPGERKRAETVLADLETLGVEELRTGFSWAEWETEEGKAWYSWLIPRLAEQVNVLPCFTYTPPELGVEEKCSAPPRQPERYADFVGRMIDRFDDCFEWVELWNEPNNTNDWDWHLDPDWDIFCRMVARAARVAKERGKKTVLAGMCPPDPNWLDLACRRGALADMDAVGVHGFPGTWTFRWEGWPATIESVRNVLARHDLDAEVWITEAGYSTWHHDEHRQVQEFVKAVEAPAERLYWYAAHDLAPDRSHQEGFHQDERHYHLGLRKANGRPKLLFRLWAGEGLAGVQSMARLEKVGGGPVTEEEKATEEVNGKAGRAPAVATGKATGNGQQPVLITGGAGFVGSNLARRLLAEGTPVLLYDNLSRPGAEHNLRGLVEAHEGRVSWELEDVRNPYALREAAAQAARVYHFAGQPAVTTSIEHPTDDFAVNARGTLNLLEALRDLAHPPPLLFTSTNKVYGALGDVELREEVTRYAPADERLRTRGIDEARPLDFQSPYGCSKGAADQYVLDYARTYDLPALVFRMSCIYGAHQFGTEDQGWVAHFAASVLRGEPITLFGDGKQVRDVLFIDDLVEALLLAHEHIDKLAGRAFNIGGGPASTTSLLELVDLLAELHGERPALDYADWRRGDQRYYVSNTECFREATGWAPQVDMEEGVRRLYEWLRERREAPALSTL